jgi:MFS family permease
MVIVPDLPTDREPAGLAAPDTADWRVRAVIAAGIATILLALLDATIVTTAAPVIARDFGGDAISRIPWLTVAYALAATVTQPLYGKLADRHGPRRVLLVALGLFTLGSVSCGFSTSMDQLVALRVVQGLGAAGLMSVTFVLFGHLRARTAQTNTGGNTAAGVMLAFGLSVGPLAGGTIVEHIEWRWIFWVNVPVCLAIIVVVSACLPPDSQRRSDPMDWIAAGLLAAGAGAAQLALTSGSGRAGWGSWRTVSAETTAVMCAGALAARQRRAANPFFPIYLLRNKVLRSLSLLQLAAGAGMAAGAIYLTLDMQLVHRYSPTRAGAQIAPMAIGVAAGAAVGSALVKRGRHLRPSLVWANTLCAAAFTALACTVAADPTTVVWLVLPVLGVGIGLSLGNELLIVQSVVRLDDLGTATAGVRFVETLGTSAGAAAFATVFAHCTSNGATPRSVTEAITLIFALGAAVMVVAACVAASRKALGDATADHLYRRRAGFARYRPGAARQAFRGTVWRRLSDERNSDVAGTVDPHMTPGHTIRIVRGSPRRRWLADSITHPGQTGCGWPGQTCGRLKVRAVFPAVEPDNMASKAAGAAPRSTLATGTRIVLSSSAPMTCINRSMTSSKRSAIWVFKKNSRRPRFRRELISSRWTDWRSGSPAERPQRTTEPSFASISKL